MKFKNLGQAWAWLMTVLFAILSTASSDEKTAKLSLPNRDTGKSYERVLGLGVVHPYPYYQKPKYRYPFYDSKGRGKLLYGYGGPETFQYKEFTPIEGHY